MPPDARANFHRDLVHAAFTGVFSGVIGTYYAVLARRLGAGEFLLALILAGPFIGSMFTVLAPYVVSGARPARRIALLWGLARLGWVGTLFIASPVPYAVVVLVFMIVGTIPAPAHTWVMRRAYPRRARGRLLGTVRAVLTLTAVVTALPAGVLLDTVGYGPVFGLAAIAGLAGAVAFGRIDVVRETAPSGRNPLASLRTAFANATFRRYTLAWNTFATGGLIAAVAVPIVLVDDFQASFTLVGAFALVQGLMGVIGFRLWGAVADRWSGPAVSWLSTLAQIVFPILFIVALVAGSVWLVLPAFAAYGLYLAGNELGWQTSIMTMARAHDTTALASAFFLTVGARGVAVPFVAGALLIVAGPIATFVLATGLIAFGSLLMLGVLRRFAPVPDDEPVDTDGAPQRARPSA